MLSVFLLLLAPQPSPEAVAPWAVARQSEDSVLAVDLSSIRSNAEGRFLVTVTTVYPVRTDRLTPRDPKALAYSLQTYEADCARRAFRGLDWRWTAVDGSVLSEGGDAEGPFYRAHPSDDGGAVVERVCAAGAAATPGKSHAEFVAEAQRFFRVGEWR